jgi:phosphocarrier protein
VNDGSPHATAEAEIGSVRRTLRITNKRGLHARAAAKFVRTVGQFDCQVRVAFKGQEVSGLSIMGLMMLAAGPGSTITVEATGKEAAEVVDAIESLISGRFDEDD